MKNCYICSENPVTRLTYIDSVGLQSTELRCNSCASTLKSNEKNKIINEVILNKSDYNVSEQSKNKNTEESPYKQAWL